MPLFARRARPAADTPLPREAPDRSADEGQDLLDPSFLIRLERLTLVAKRLVETRRRGERQSPRRRGASLEFADYRDYAPGDPLRRIDWNVYARLERLLVRLYEGEHDLGVDLLVDCSESMAFGSPTKLSEARRLAAAIGYVALAAHDRVRVLACDRHARPLTPFLVGRDGARHLLRVLASLRAGGATDLAAAATDAGAGRARSRMAVLFSDLLDPGGPAGPGGGSGLEQALGRLLAQRKRIAVLQVTDDRCDGALPLEGDLELVDAETGERLAIDGSAAARRGYAAAFEAFCEAQSALCSRRAIGYVRARTSRPFEETVLRALRESGVLA